MKPILLLSLWLSFGLVQLSAQINEQAFFQQFLQQRVDSNFIQYCTSFRPLPDFCLQANGQSSAYCIRLKEHTYTSWKEWKQTEKYVMVKDSLLPLDLRDYADFKYGNPPLSVEDSLFLLKSVVKQPTVLPQVDTIFENGLRLASWTRFQRAFPEVKPGKNRYFLNVGLFVFSRAFYEEKNNRGVFSFIYYGGPTCGYTGFCFFERVKGGEDWKFTRIYYTGEF